jgi:serine protease Do
MKIKNIAATVLISAATALASVFMYSKYENTRPGNYQNGSHALPVNYVSYTGNEHAKGSSAPTSFEQAASIVIPTAVHIKTTIAPKKINDPDNDFFGGNDPFGNLFGGGGQYYEPGEKASGSGVIISDNGYIVTCNHVVDGASKITVTLNNRTSYPAKVIGRDPNTDLAVIKIDAQNLPYILYGNSDNVKVGQWVLAAGYPLDLETTVTAGIVSAKSRQIGVNQDGVDPIEAFIQTDAAVNPGNSGGPLVNTEGQLVGINSAIASPTGSFAGYAYAIPVNIVKKVVNDILKYGTVQRAFLGVRLSANPTVQPASYDSRDNDGYGVPIAGVDPTGGAAAAGLRAGDIITKVDDDPVNSEPQLMEKIASYHPGDKVNVTFVRDGKEKNVVVTLRNRDGSTGLVTNSALDKLGADFEALSRKDAYKLGITGGVQVDNIGEGLIKDQTNMQPGFVITRVNKYPVNSVEQLRKIVDNSGSSLQIEGVYPGYEGVYYYGINNLE